MRRSVERGCLLVAWTCSFKEYARFLYFFHPDPVHYPSWGWQGSGMEEGSRPEYVRLQDKRRMLHGVVYGNVSKVG
jgi:hypothetical protein